jgi:hypothetical protein
MALRPQDCQAVRLNHDAGFSCGQGSLPPSMSRTN